MKEQKLIKVQLADLTPSLTNPRKTITTAPDWAEFVDSIRTHGVKQPPLVRPYPPSRKSNNPALWEIVAGERRFTAAKEAKLESINVLVEELTDAEAVEIQQIENLQRADLSALEEAQGYADWRDSLLKPGPGGQPAQCKTVETAVEHIAAKINRKRTAVYGKLALLKTAPPVQAALKAGELDASKAALIAQVPSAADQEELLRAATGEGDVDALSYRALKEEIEKKYRITLVGAPFKTSEIYPGPKEMFINSCTVCPHRSGNIVDATGSPNICTNPACFRLKCDAVAGKASTTASAVWDEKTWKKNRYDHEYVRADEANYNDPERRTWEKILGAHAPVPIVALGREYKGNSDTEELTLLRYFKRADAYKICKEKQLIKATPAKERKPCKEELAEQKEREQAEALRAERKVAMAARMTEIVSGSAHTLFKANPLEFWRTLALTAFETGADGFDDTDVEAVMKGHGMGHQVTTDKLKNLAIIRTRLQTEPAPENLLGYTVEFLLRCAGEWFGYGKEVKPCERENLLALWPADKTVTPKAKPQLRPTKATNKPSPATAKRIMKTIKKLAKKAVKKKSK